MICPKCGAELPRNSLRCQKCLNPEPDDKRLEPGTKTLENPEPGTETLENSEPGAKTLENSEPGAETLENSEPGAKKLDTQDTKRRPKNREEIDETENSANISCYPEGTLKKKDIPYHLLSSFQKLALEGYENPEGRKPKMTPYKGFTTKPSQQQEFPEVVDQATIWGIADSAVKPEEKKVSYLLCPPLYPMKLKKGHPFTIGRDESNMMYLPSREVSRFHAVVEWKEEKYILRDLGSANGTMVNGIMITEYPLQNGDRIYIATSTITYQEITTETTVNPLQSSKDTLRINTAGLRLQEELQVPKKQSSLHGNIQTVGLFAVLQMLAMDCKSGCLHLKSSKGEGDIFLVDGAVVHCESKKNKGDQAFFDLVFWNQGTFEFDPAKAPTEISMSNEIESLLLECARRMDEQNRSKH